ncbi:MAG: glycerophosphodiester phosphodiesterase [Gammaproteobacteria bacterium]|nr:glycerophosphodiester phosphodiesterase [Gammaproteobacteria bacterium]
MKLIITVLSLTLVTLAVSTAALAKHHVDENYENHDDKGHESKGYKKGNGSSWQNKYHGDDDRDGLREAELGPRPFYLVNDMDEGELKKALKQCEHGPFYESDFSIGHRGAALKFPEHTKESYMAAAEMGAGILECDVTFTRDRKLVCRHSQCDLHTTTNILATPLAAKCLEPFTPALLDTEGNVIQEASAKCCTSDITLAEFKTLTGKMDAENKGATTVEEYLDATPSWRTDLYTGKGTLLTHVESIELFKSLGAKMTPELKSPSVPMPFEGDYTQEDYAQQMIDEYKKAGVDAEHVWAQSFNLGDLRYWIDNEPKFGEQAVYLDGRYENPAFDHTKPYTWEPSMEELVDMGVEILAPPMWMLLKVNRYGEIVPSIYARRAQRAGLDIITWTIERSGLLKDGGGWYYQTVTDVINNDGDMLEVLDVLAKDVGIIGIFSDWPATVTYYANCMDLE